MRKAIVCIVLALALLPGTAFSTELYGGRDNLDVEYAYYAYPNWQTTDGWDKECYYSTIQTADLDGDGTDEILGRTSEGLEVWAVDASTNIATYLTTLTYMSNSGNWDNAWYYETIQAGDINGDGSDEVIARGVDGIVAWSFDGSNNSFTRLADGPAWSNDAGWKENAIWYESIGLADLDGDGAKELVGRDSTGLLAYKYDGDSDSWTQLATLTAVDDASFGYPMGVNPMAYEAAVASLCYGNVYSVSSKSGNDYSTDEVIMLTEDQGLAVFHYDASSDSWSTKADNSGHFSDLNTWYNDEYYNSIQTYRKYLGSDFQYFLAARGTDGLGLYKWTSDGWSLMENLDYFSDSNGWKHGNYSRTITMTDVNGDSVADAAAWHGDGAEVLLCNDLSTGTTWTQVETLGLSEDMGWQEAQFDSTVQWAELDGDTSNGSEMLIRGSSGVRIYDYDSTNVALTDFRDAYPVFTGEEGDAYDYIISSLQNGIPGFGSLLDPDYDLREIYGNIGVDNWLTFAWFVNNIDRPSDVSEDAWDTVVTQLDTELTTLSNVQGKYYAAREALFDTVFAACSNKIDEVVGNVEYGAQSLDNQIAQFIVSNLIQSVSKAITVVAGAKLETMAAKVVANVVITVSTSVVSSASNSALFSDPNLSSSTKLELAGVDIKSTLDAWFATNKERFSDLYADMVSTMGGLNLANDTVNAAGGSLVDFYDQTAYGIVQNFQLWLYQTLMPVEYDLKYTTNGDSNGPYGQIYLFHADPPDYDLYRNGTKWTWAEHSAGTYPSEDLLNIIWGLGVDKADFYKAQNGWDFSVSEVN